MNPRQQQLLESGLGLVVALQKSHAQSSVWKIIKWSVGLLFLKFSISWLLEPTANLPWSYSKSITALHSFGWLPRVVLLATSWVTFCRTEWRRTENGNLTPYAPETKLLTHKYSDIIRMSGDRWPTWHGKNCAKGECWCLWTGSPSLVLLLISPLGANMPGVATAAKISFNGLMVLGSSVLEKPSKFLLAEKGFAGVLMLLLNAGNITQAQTVGIESQETLPTALFLLLMMFGESTLDLTRSTTGMVCFPFSYTYLPYVGFAWAEIEGSGVQISVGKDGTVWCINRQQEIFRRNGLCGSWERVDGRLTHLSVFDKDTIIGNNSNHEVFQWQGEWLKCPGKTTTISVGKKKYKSVWGVNSAHHIWHHKG